VGIAIHDAQQQLYLVALRNRRQWAQEVIFGDGRIAGAAFGGRLDEIGVDSEKFREGLQGAGQRTDARRRLDFRVGNHMLHRRQPQQIKQPEIAREHVGAQRRNRGKPARAVIPFVVGLNFIRVDIDDQVIVAGPCLDPLDFANKGLDGQAVQKAQWQPHHQATRAPIREIKMQIEPLLHQLARIASEVAEIVVVGEARRANARSRGNRPQSLLGASIERPVDGQEFVILIFAHKSLEAGLRPSPGRHVSAATTVSACRQRIAGPLMRTVGRSSAEAQSPDSAFTELRMADRWRSQRPQHFFGFHEA